MTNEWTNGEGLQGYAACTADEAAAKFAKRFGRKPERVITVGWNHYCGPEDKDDDDEPWGGPPPGGNG
jgi:hypothetical protein